MPWHESWALTFPMRFTLHCPHLGPSPWPWKLELMIFNLRNISEHPPCVRYSEQCHASWRVFLFPLYFKSTQGVFHLYQYLKSDLSFPLSTGYRSKLRVRYWRDIFRGQTGLGHLFTYRMCAFWMSLVPLLNVSHHLTVYSCCVWTTLWLVAELMAGSSHILFIWGLFRS